MSERRADIGVYGGSGFYRFLDDIEEVKVETPYGPPSDLIALATVGDKRVAFLPRHGRRHTLPPHVIPYKANACAMKQLGVGRIIAPSAAGSLQPHVKPGDFVVCDQFVDRTSGRSDTFYDGPIATHITAAEPYCGEMRRIAVEAIKTRNIPVHERGTVVVIQGPRFSTKAESSWYMNMGWEVINMTQYPEVVLARELEMCYVNISLITDYDAGIVSAAGVEPVTAEEIIKVLDANNERVRNVILDVIERTRVGPCPECGKALAAARLD